MKVLPCLNNCKDLGGMGWSHSIFLSNKWTRIPLNPFKKEQWQGTGLIVLESMLQKQYQHDRLEFQCYRTQQYKADPPLSGESQVNTPTARLPKQTPQQSRGANSRKRQIRSLLEGRSQTTFFIFTYCHLSRANDLQTQRLFLFWRKTFTVDFPVSSPCKSIPVLQDTRPSARSLSTDEAGSRPGPAQRAPPASHWQPLRATRL